MLVGIVASLLSLYGIAFSQESAPSAPAAGVATPDSRLACPPDVKVDEDVKLIRAAYEAAYEQAKDTGEPDSLIQQLVGLSNETPDPAKKYALLLEAEAVATQYENYTTALDLLAKRAEKFQIDGLKLKGQLLKRLAGPKVAADLVLFDQASDTAEQAMQAERFDVAAETALLALSVARAVDREQKVEARKRGRTVGKAGKDETGTTPVGPGLVKKATALQSQVTAAQKLFAEYGEALVDIKSQPDDAAANSVVAQYLCFVRGDWQRGLLALAKSDIDRLKTVAADEISLLNDENRDPKRVFDLAGAWWTASDSKGLTDDQQAAVKDHAAGFYAEVAENLSDVLEKKLAQSRLRGLTKKPRFVAGQVFLSDLREINPVTFNADWPLSTHGQIKFEPIVVGGVKSPKGIGMHPPEAGSARVTYQVPKGAKTFEADAAVNDSSNAASPLTFRVVSANNGRVLWKTTEPLQKGGSSNRCIVDVNGVDKITLYVDCPGSPAFAHAVWVEPRFNIQRDEDKRTSVAYLSDLSEIDPVTLEGHGFGKNGYVLTFAISVRGVKSPNGLGMHPPESGSAEVTYDVPKGAKTFKADAAINDSNNPASPLTFRVVATSDGRVLWKSQTPLRNAGASIPCMADVHGVDKITLYVDCPGSPNGSHAVWVEPRFIQDPARNIGIEVVRSSIGMELIHIPAGTFQMGEGPSAVAVKLARQFLLGKTEVTRGQWQQVMGTKPWGDSGDNSDADLPASHVNWDEVTEFCRKLTDRERANGKLPASEVYRLPTEAEWECACRAGTTTSFSSGDEESTLDDFGWFLGNAEGNVHPVGTKKPNAWGLYDMHGNVWEQCSDWYDGKLSGGVDPEGPAGGSNRVHRGGCWGCDPVACRSATRSSYVPSDRARNLGFRVARSQSGGSDVKTSVTSSSRLRRKWVQDDGARFFQREADSPVWREHGRDGKAGNAFDHLGETADYVEIVDGRRKMVIRLWSDRWDWTSGARTGPWNAAQKGRWEK